MGQNILNGSHICYAITIHMGSVTWSTLVFWMFAAAAEIGIGIWKTVGPAKDPIELLDGCAI
jgi:hypothetical protein